MLPMDSRARIRDAPVTTLTGGSAIAATIWWWADHEDAAVVLSSLYSAATPFGLFASTFLHVDIFHLLFNLYWLWIFGTQVEKAFGSARTAGLMLILALGSVGAERAVLEGGIGLSGVGYGLFGIVAVMSRHDGRFWMTRGVVQLFVLWFFFCIFATVEGFYRVANIAHAFGALLGALLGLAISATAQVRRRVALGGLVCATVLALSGASFLRPLVNLVGAPERERAYQLAYEGYLVLESDCARAIELYREAVALEEHQSDWWYNLGIAYQDCGRDAEALAAYRRAVELWPDDSSRGDVAHYVSALEGRDAWHSGDIVGAIEFYRAAAELKPEDAETWYALATLYMELDRRAEALDAAKRAVGLDQSKPEYRELLDELRGDPAAAER